MSNTRVFDYNEISNIYNQMNQIIGDNSDPSSIAGLLYKIDENYHEVVNGPAGEDALALRGDLAKQLLNNWENTAGSFPAFVENFSTWSTLVAQAAGDYKVFEETVKGIRADNPLGWNTGGIQQGYVASSSYTTAKTDAELDQLAQGAQFYDLVGAYYVDTGMVSYAKKAGFWNAFGDILSVVSIVASGCSLVKGLSVAGTAAKGAGAAAGAVDDVAANGIDDMINSGHTLGTNGAWHPAANTAGAPTAANSIFNSMDDVAGAVDDVAANGIDDLISTGHTLGTDGAWHAAANTAGAPTAANTIFGTADDVVANGVDDLISTGHTLGTDGAWHAAANTAGAPTAANTIFGTADDVVANGVDDLISTGHTLGTDGAWHAAANTAGAPTVSNSVFNSLDDVAANGVDDLINSGHTLGTNGTWHAAANTAGAPNAANTILGTADDVATGSIDDLVTHASKLNTVDKVNFVEKLRANGTISNSDDFLKFFGGNESVAKTAYTAFNGGHGGGSAVRGILKGFESAGGVADDIAGAGAKAITGSVDDLAANGIDDLISSGHTLGTNGSWSAAANTAGAPTSYNTIFGTADDVVANGVDDLISSGHTLGSNGAWNAAANTAGAPTAANTIFGTADDVVANGVDDLISSGHTLGSNGAWNAAANTAGAPTAANTIFGTADDVAANGIDDLINSGHTLGTNGSWNAAANTAGAPTASNSIFNFVDDAGGAVDDIAGTSVDDLLNKGYTMGSDGTLYKPATSFQGAPSSASTSALAGDLSKTVPHDSINGFNKLGYYAREGVHKGTTYVKNGFSDVAKGSVDDMIGKNMTLTPDGWMKPASMSGAPSSAATSALAGDLSKTVAHDSVGTLAKGSYYIREGAHATGQAVKNGLSTAGNAVKTGFTNAGTAVKNGLSHTGTAVKNGLSNAGTAVKNGLSHAGTAVKTGLSTAKNGLATAGTWVKENGVTVLKDTATGLGTSGLIGQGTNIAQNVVNNTNMQRTAEMVALARERFGNNGNGEDN